jgi:flavin reductase (DIM6/NTAB) family NADH-FMN oxidoreductase RutF
MTVHNISIGSFHLNAYSLWEDSWLLLTAGDFSTGRYNAMTVSWGSIGSLWQRPIAQVFVRPQRFTFELINEFDTFTLCAFSKENRKSMSLMGSRSGRDLNKAQTAGLTPVAATLVAAPAYEEAELIIECRKLYWADFDPAHFLDASIRENYPQKDYHRAFYGEILAIRGSEKYG